MSASAASVVGGGEVGLPTMVVSTSEGSMGGVLGRLKLMLRSPLEALVLVIVWPPVVIWLRRSLEPQTALLAYSNSDGKLRAAIGAVLTAHALGKSALRPVWAKLGSARDGPIYD
jgi:hypothetical protein